MRNTASTWQNIIPIILKKIHNLPNVLGDKIIIKSSQIWTNLMKESLTLQSVTRR